MSGPELEKGGGVGPSHRSRDGRQIDKERRYKRSVEETHGRLCVGYHCDRLAGFGDIRLAAVRSADLIRWELSCRGSA